MWHESFVLTTVRQGIIPTLLDGGESTLFYVEKDTHNAVMNASFCAAVLWAAGD